MSRRRTTSIAAALLCLALSGCADDDSARESATPGVPAAETVTLVVDGPPAGKCALPNAAVLATLDTAFEGTVTDLADGVATLSVSQWYAGGDAAEEVIVATPDHDLQGLLLAVDFEEGKTYLVSSLDGHVSLCGFSAETSPELKALYDEAFSD